MAETKGQKHWSKMKEKGLKHYMYVATPLKYMVMIIMLSFVIDMIYGYRQVNQNYFLIELLIKVILSALAGANFAYKDWGFREKLYSKHFNSMKDIQNAYVKIFGIWNFGIFTGIAMINPLFDTLLLTVIKVVMFLIAGYVWGKFMAAFSLKNMEVHLD